MMIVVLFLIYGLLALTILSMFGVFFTYIEYPWILKFLSKGKKHHFPDFQSIEEVPEIVVIMSVYNEEEVIEKKIESVFNCSTPFDKGIHFFIGSDKSSDSTLTLLKNAQKVHPSIRILEAEQRSGKSKLVNKLVLIAKKEFPNAIVIMTDANVIFKEDTIVELIKPFSDPVIGIVGANVLNYKQKENGIGLQESRYIARENKIKDREGRIWGTSMGAFGACYAAKLELVDTIPENYLMEDFFISMRIMEKGFKSIHLMSAVCYEDLPGSVEVEFNRKRRISTGNFQNLSTFYKWCFRVFDPIGFCFVSHKVLRWLTPFFLLVIFISSAFLSLYLVPMRIIFWVMVFVLSTPFIDKALQKVGWHSIFLRFISYFIKMNVALFLGFIDFLKGVKTSAWQPTERNENV